MQRAIEEAGIPTIIIAALPPVVRQTGTPRAVAPLVPMGANAGEPNNPDMQRDIVKATLEQLVAIDTPGKVVSLPFEYIAKEEGIIAAIESSHAVAHVMKIAPKMDKDQIIICCLSGRGDKDVAAIARYRGIDLHE